MIFKRVIIYLFLDNCLKTIFNEVNKNFSSVPVVFINNSKQLKAGMVIETMELKGLGIFHNITVLGIDHDNHVAFLKAEYGTFYGAKVFDFSFNITFNEDF